MPARPMRAHRAWRAAVGRLGRWTTNFHAKRLLRHTGRSRAGRVTILARQWEWFARQIDALAAE
jgi:hypothetical protein